LNPHAIVRVVAAAALLMIVAGCASLRRGSRCDAAAAATVMPRLTATTDSLLSRPRPVTDSAVAALHQQLVEIIARVHRVEVCGGLASASDQRAASRLALRAGIAGAPVLREAYVWGRAAVVRGPEERESWRAMASAWDELQLSESRPQWFGTVIRCAPRGPRPCAVATIDATHVSDAQRVELGLRTLREQRLVADSLNRSRRR
jgi:hypothetical protein